MGGEERVARARPRPRSEDLTFPSFDGTQIAGTLLIPPGEGPHPAFVWVHGSGPVTRGSADLWPYAFADLGYAVLTVDKRGVGRSGGSYTLPDGSRDNPAHMERRARDVRAALAALRARPDVDGERIGLVGVSQAGWVIPLAAEAGGVAAAIVLSGGLTPVSVEGVFSAVAGEDGSSADAKPIEECLVRARAHRPTDRDFRGALEALACPALWLYGDLDRSNPTELCVELIESVRAAHGNDFTVRRFPKAGHSLLTARYGGGAETGTLSAYDPSMHVTLEEWLATKMPVRR
jgi:dienelactone hydrolase